MVKLYEIKKGSKIYENVIIDGKTIEGSYIKFGQLDGMYSYSQAYDKKGELLMNGDNIAVVHLQAATPLISYKDGYKIGEE